MCDFKAQRNKTVFVLLFFSCSYHTEFKLCVRVCYDAEAVYPDSGDDCPGGGGNKAAMETKQQQTCFFLWCLKVCMRTLIKLELH